MQPAGKYPSKIYVSIYRILTYTLHRHIASYKELMDQI